MEYDDLFIAVDFNTLFAKGRPSWIRSKRESGKSPHSKITRLLNCDADKLWSGSVPMITRNRLIHSKISKIDYLSQISMIFFYII